MNAMPEGTDPEKFRKHAHEAVDWIADYMKSVRGLPVVPACRPGEIRAALPDHPPAEPEPLGEVMRDFREKILPGMTHWNHPRWFAYFPANNSPPSVLAEMLTSAIGAQCMSWITSPAATELEQVVMQWLAELAGLPGGFTGTIQDSASSSTLVALISARERATKNGFGLVGAAAEGAEKLTVYSSTEAHSSVEKGVRLAGLGLSRYRKIAVDKNFAMIPEELEKSMSADAAAGFVPCCVVGASGTTSSTAVDPLRDIGEICARHGAWFHVDAAYAGSAAIVPEYRWVLDGTELADSLVFNPHKWLFTNFDCSAYYVKDVASLLGAFSMDPEYLKTAHDDKAVNFRDWGIPLGRRFRALKLWFVLRSFGASGLRDMIRKHVGLAARFRSMVESDPEFEVMAPSPLGLVCFRFRPGSMADGPELDALNAKLLAAANATGRMHASHTKLAGRYALRMSVGQLRTELADVEEAWRIIRGAAAKIR